MPLHGPHLRKPPSRMLPVLLEPFPLHPYALDGRTNPSISHLNSTAPTKHNVHLRRPRHWRENRPPDPSSKGLFSSRPRRRVSTTHEAIPALSENRSGSQLARVSRVEQELPQLPHGERPDGAGRDEEFGLWGRPDCHG